MEERLFWSVAIDKKSIFRHLGKIAEAEEELLVYFDAQINVKQIYVQLKGVAFKCGYNQLRITSNDPTIFF